MERPAAQRRSGALLLAAKATTMVVNPAFWIKRCASAGGREPRRRSGATCVATGWPAAHLFYRGAAGVSMLLWLGAITTGRVDATPVKRRGSAH